MATWIGGTFNPNKFNPYKFNTGRLVDVTQPGGGAAAGLHAAYAEKRMAARKRIERDDWEVVEIVCAAVQSGILEE